MKILLADDHTLIRETIGAFLAGEESDFRVVTAATVDEALEAVATRGPFDVILLDYNMPGMNGFSGLDRVREAAPESPVAILSGTVTRVFADEAMEAGASGFIPKTLPAKSMARAIRFMAMGERYLPVDLADAPVADEPALLQRLTERERQVLERLCRGLANKEIARELDLQEVTVKLHVKTLCRKLDARNRTQAAIIAKEAGLF
jgi:DNA-binding NarL/FixJ family response regulator